MMNLQELKNNTLNKRDTKRKIKEIFSCPLIQLIVELDLRFEILPNENKMKGIIFNHYRKIPQLLITIINVLFYKNLN